CQWQTELSVRRLSCIGRALLATPFGVATKAIRIPIKSTTGSARRRHTRTQPRVKSCHCGTECWAQKRESERSQERQISPLYEVRSQNGCSAKLGFPRKASISKR